jgi:hypothetical protein
MSSLKQKRSEPEGLDLIFLTISQELLVQLSTGPLLIALLGSKAAAETLETIGQASEEIFRGDRLPVLKFPVETKP